MAVGQSQLSTSMAFCPTIANDSMSFAFIGASVSVWCDDSEKVNLGNCANEPPHKYTPKPKAR